VAQGKNEFPIALPMDEDGVVTQDPKELKRYISARNGDGLITPFQCDWCHFENLTGRRPSSIDGQDQFLLKSIRRAQLDAFWATEPTTVAKNLSELKRGWTIAAALGCKHGMFRPMGPYPVEDTFTYSDWFSRFAKGCHKRMGDNVRPDRAISVGIMQETFRQLEFEWNEGVNDKYELALEGAYYIIAYCCALRGEEIGKADLGGISKHFEESGVHAIPHVVIALLGRFKGETGTAYHLMPLVLRTRSGLEPRKWIGRLLGIYRKRGISHGPFFWNEKGALLQVSEMSEIFNRRLSFVQYFRPDLLPRDVDIEDV